MRLSLRNFLRSRYARRAFGLYFGSLAAGLLIALALVYFVALTTLKKNERQLVELKAEEVSSTYAKSGIEGLRRPHAWAYIRIKNHDGKILFESTPGSETGYDLSLLDRVEPLAGKGTWTHLPKKDDEDVLHVLSRSLAPDLVLQVGKSDAELNDQIELLLGSLLGIIGPLLFLSMGVAFFAVRRALGPVLELVSTVKKVKEGALSARVPEGDSAGEVRDLIRLLNSMLDQIESLVELTRSEVDHFAHDIRTPIASFRLLAERALIADDSPEALRAALEEAVGAADRISTLISAIFDIALSESGALRIDSVPFDLAAIVEEVCDLYDFAAEEKDLKISRNLSANVRLSGDPIQIRRAVANILDNAVKYSDRPGTIAVEIRQNEREVSISVEDEGPGILESERTKIWKKLYRGTSVHPTDGFGLGLNFVQGIVMAHSGTAEFESVSPRGARFVLRFPKDYGLITNRLGA